MFPFDDVIKQFLSPVNGEKRSVNLSAVEAFAGNEIYILTYVSVKSDRRSSNP